MTNQRKLTHLLLSTLMAALIASMPMFASAKAAAPWLQALQEQNWVHAILFFCIAFHTFYGLKLFAGELGYSFHYKTAFWAIAGVSALFGLREVLRYAGI